MDETNTVTLNAEDARLLALLLKRLPLKVETCAQNPDEAYAMQGAVERLIRAAAGGAR